MRPVAMSGGMAEVARAICKEDDSPVDRTRVGNTSLNIEAKMVAAFEPKYITKNGTRIQGDVSSDAPAKYKARPPIADSAISMDSDRRLPIWSDAQAPVRQPS